ncbi:MAG: nucleotidyltransferase family protein [Clostridia bacterium]|nr:nucleotidyltransferase family protein [Clostridia bacterium]MBQ4620606.1 nucleotidyltransferase family protein [Clostridia bacterium]
MIIAGIISEYNPFHAGHKYHIEKTRSETNCDYVVACMSGAFTQRGEMAFMDKFDRVRMALQGGCDAVFELPQECAVRPAEWFARGGVSVLDQIGCDVLSFGTESGDKEELFRLFHLLSEEPEEIKSKIREGLLKGMTLARARGEALKDICPGLENMPNLSLALEYLASLKILKSKMDVCVIKRTAPYHAQKADKGLSASEIRMSVQNGNAQWAIDNMPEEVRDEFQSSLFGGVSEKARMDSVFLHILRTMSPGDREQLPDAGEGLSERIYQKAQTAVSLEDLIESVKCKRYTRARITRVIAAAVLKMQKEAPKEAPYARLLGFRRESAPLIKELDKRSNGKIISSSDAVRTLPAFLTEMRATDLWGLSAQGGRYRKAGRECTEKFIVIG